MEASIYESRTFATVRFNHSSKMHFETMELSAHAEFDELVRVEWESFEQPYCRLIRLFFPLLDNGSDPRAEALKESTERQLQWHNGDPTSHWIKVVDTETERIVGAACWHIYEENPYSTESDGDCTWYPAGEAREMANSLMGQFLTPRTKYMAKPHIFLDICFVHPEYRRRGIGRLLMAWGINKADQMGLESYIDATEAGIALYETCGFVKASRADFNASKDQPSPRWKELQAELLPFSFWPMWRPVGGRFERDTVEPWKHGS